MRLVGLILIRLCLILCGYAFAALAASMFLHLIAWPLFSHLAPEHPDLLMGGLLVSVPVGALFLSYFAFLPAVLLIGLAELRGYRRWIYHALAGGLAALAAVLLARQTRDMPRLPESDIWEVPLVWMPEVAAAAAAAGLVGGMAYWLVAGRSSGGRLAATAPAPSGSSPRRP